MLDVLLWTVPIVMTATTLWRLPSLWNGDALQRALWMCCCGFAAALWCRVPPVKFALDHSPVTDLSALLKYLTSLAAILAGLKYIIAAYERPSGRGAAPRHVTVSVWVSRIAHGFALAWLAILIVLFFTAVDRSEPSTDFAADHAGQWGAELFLTVAYIYLGAAAGVACFQWGRASRRAEYRSLRIGLALMSAAMLIYAVYPALRIITVWAPTGANAVTMRTIADSVTLTVALLWAVGAAIPSTIVLAERRAAWRTHQKLFPLWSDLIRQYPQLAAQPAGSRLSETFRVWAPWTSAWTGGPRRSLMRWSNSVTTPHPDSCRAPRTWPRSTRTPSPPLRRTGSERLWKAQKLAGAPLHLRGRSRTSR